jgi:hypothetical protein
VNGITTGEEISNHDFTVFSSSSSPTFARPNCKTNGQTNALGKSRKLSRRCLGCTDAADMLKRRLKQPGLPAHYSPHSFRATGITKFLENDGALEVAQRIAGHADSRAVCSMARITSGSNGLTDFKDALASTRLASTWILLPLTNPASTHWWTTRLKSDKKSSLPQRFGLC